MTGAGPAANWSARWTGWPAQPAQPGPARPGPAVGGPGVQHQRQRHGGDRDAARRHHPRAAANCCSPRPWRPVRVRGIESLKERAGAVSGVARVALNLRGAGRRRPAAWRWSSRAGGRWPAVADVRLGSPPGPRPPRAAHRAHRLGPDRGPGAAAGRPDRPAHACATPLPLHVGDRLLLRDPGRRGRSRRARRAWPAGATVLDVAPPAAGPPRRGRRGRRRAGRVAGRAAARPSCSGGTGCCGRARCAPWG